MNARWAVVIGCVAVAASAGAQKPVVPAVVPAVNTTRPLQERPRDSSRDSSAVRVPWYAPVASLAVPGLGQAVLRQDRALAYLALEAYSYVGYRAQTIEGKRERNRYRGIAHDVARVIFGDPRPSGRFDYYEAMEKYVESGAFDRIPGGDVDPEVDETTFNGSMWRLARETFWSDPNVAPPADSPAFASAVSLYLQRAVQGDRQWSWRDAALEHDLYRRSIARSNDAFRRAREQLGILVANHLLSMTDAFASVRVRYPSADYRSAWSVSVSLPWPSER